MEIYFLTNYYKKTKFMQEQYDTVLDILFRLDVTIYSQEKGESFSRFSQLKKNKLKIIDEYNTSSILNTINKVDALIVENTHESFLVGHLVTLALERRKPILLIQSSHEQLPFLPKSRFIHTGFYNRFSLIKIVRDFLEEVEKQSISEEIHFKLSTEHKKYILKQAKGISSTSSEYIRKLIEKDILEKNETNS